ncbi:MAG: 3,4-dehydroadipyl-CoA semialdehyde dehydrogenase [Acidobacteriota bacterium]
MKTLRSYVLGNWHEATTGFIPLFDPATGQQIARASSDGVDFQAVLDFARTRGGPALRGMTFAERGAMLKALSRALKAHMDELLDLSRRNNGTTKGDGLFDVAGASGTLAYYAGLARGLGDRRAQPDGDGVQLARTEGFWGQHLWVSRRGVAVHINAFNFPAWGFAEKAACALLAGVPVITKPATSTALVTERCVEILLEAGVLPEGALQMVCGRTGDLLDRLGPQDVVAFTGSADTARALRANPGIAAANTRFNVEADSLNAAVLAPGVGPGSATWDLFVRDVVREMTQKAGQKCTAVRRILVPTSSLDGSVGALSEALGNVVTGNPADPSVTMGPLVNSSQLEDAEAGVRELTETASVVHGTGERIVGAGDGYYFGPTLLRADDPHNAGRVHDREVFGPVATLLPYDGDAADAADLVALGGGTLVTSLYGDDPDWLEAFLTQGAEATGRIYIGSEGSAGDAPGSGVALPQSLHGGPGRAGGGEELGGLVGLRLYQQRIAVQGERSLVERLTGVSD